MINKKDISSFNVRKMSLLHVPYMGIRILLSCLNELLDLFYFLLPV